VERAIRTPIDDAFIVGVLQLKGGSGKTTTTWVAVKDGVTWGIW
jgi:hypothetical protein